MHEWDPVWPLSGRTIAHVDTLNLMPVNHDPQECAEYHTERTFKLSRHKPPPFSSFSTAVLTDTPDHTFHTHTVAVGAPQKPPRSPNSAPETRSDSHRLSKPSSRVHADYVQPYTPHLCSRYTKPQPKCLCTESGIYFSRFVVYAAVWTQTDKKCEVCPGVLGDSKSDEKQEGVGKA